MDLAGGVWVLVRSNKFGSAFPATRTQIGTNEFLFSLPLKFLSSYSANSKHTHITHSQLPVFKLSKCEGCSNNIFRCHTSGQRIGKWKERSVFLSMLISWLWGIAKLFIVKNFTKQTQQYRRRGRTLAPLEKKESACAFVPSVNCERGLLLYFPEAAKVS